MHQSLADGGAGLGGELRFGNGLGVLATAADEMMQVLELIGQRSADVAHEAMHAECDALAPGERAVDLLGGELGKVAAGDAHHAHERAHEPLHEAVTQSRWRWRCWFPGVHGVTS